LTNFTNFLEHFVNILYHKIESTKPYLTQAFFFFSPNYLMHSIITIKTLCINVLISNSLISKQIFPSTFRNAQYIYY
jgi:hypothetical protein